MTQSFSPLSSMFCHSQRVFPALATRSYTRVSAAGMQNIRCYSESLPLKSVGNDELADAAKGVENVVQEHEQAAKPYAESYGAAERERYRRERVRLGFEAYTNYRPDNWRHQRVMREWISAGPPPISEYRLTFGKHKGKRLEEVPDTYMVKYLIPGRLSGQYISECPIVVDAVEDFMKRHPNVKSQAGPAKVKPIKNGIMKVPGLKKISRKSATKVKE